MNLVRELWDRFLLYLPLTVMGVLALGTYWLLHTTPATSSPVAPSAVRHEPDYYMLGFSLRTFDATGRMRTEVTGAEARHYPDTRWLEIDGIRLRSFDEQGRLTTASARKGLSNENTTEVQLLGNAVIVREATDGPNVQPSPRMEYRSEFLHAFTKSEKIRSHKPVELIRGRDRFSADAMEFDNVEQVLQMNGRVRGTLVPGTP